MTTIKDIVTAALDAAADVEAAAAAALAAIASIPDNLDTEDGAIAALVSNPASSTASAIAAGYVSTSTRPNHAPALGLYFPEAEGAVGDGTTNDAAALTAALTAASTAGKQATVIGRGGAVYGISSTVTVPNDVRLYALTIKDITGNLSILNVGSCSDVTITGCRLIGSGVLGTPGRAAIWGAGTGTNRLKIIGNTIDGVGTCGIALEDAHETIIQGNNIRNTGEHCIYISTDCDDLLIADNVIANPGIGYGTSVTAVKIARCSNVHLRDNIIDNSGGGGSTNDGIIFEFDTAHCSAIGNVIRNCSGLGLRVNAVGAGTNPPTDITIQENLFTGITAQCIRVFGGDRVRIDGNKFTATTAPSILTASGSTDVHITNNLITQSGGFNGIDLTVTGAILSGNIARHTGGGSSVTIRATSTGVELKSDNVFPTVANSAGAGAKLGAAISDPASASTLGTIVRKAEVFDAKGTSMGFVPVYDAIT